MRRSILALALTIAAAGCYDSHGLFGSSPDEDGSVGPDGRPGWDGGGFDAPFDAGVDAPPDARLDTGLDAGTDSHVPGRDAAPPAPTHPRASTCRIEPEIHAFDDPVLEYEWPNGPVEHGSAVHVSMTPLVIDLDTTDGNIEPVLVFVSYPPLSRETPPGVLRIVDPRTDETITWPPEGSGMGGVLEPTTNLAAGDIDGDGKSEIVGIGVHQGSFAFEHDGTLKWESRYPTALDRGGTRISRSISGAPTLADLEGDGTVEVIVGRNVLEGATGAHRWTGGDGTGRATNQFLGPISCVADLDGDGEQEVIAGHTAFRPDGEVYWNNPDAQDGLCAVADIFPDNEGPEVVLSAKGFVRILDGQTGEQLWVRQLEGRVRISIGGAPTVADFEGDGEPEIGVAHGGAYGVYDPQCEAPGRPAECTGKGLLWKSATSDASSSGTGSSVFDFNGDGRAEVVYNDEHYFRIYDGTTGDPLFQHRNSSRTRTENPTIADIDNDGDAEIIFCANAEAFYIKEYYTDPGVEIWGDARGRWVGARRIWNQHAYHITNVEEDGRIPSPETPSWERLNAYRQNLREGGDVLVVPDLWGGHGTYECTGEGSRAVLRANVQNWGLERAGAGVVVSFWRGDPRDGGERIGEAETTRTLEPEGDSEVVELEVELEEPVTDYWAIIDDPEDPPEGAVQECREGNNRVLFWRPTCP